MAVRMLGSQPGLGAVGVLTLGLGIGLTTMVFSIVNTTLIEGLPFEDPQELVIVQARDRRTGNTIGLRQHDYVDWRNHQRSFDHLAGFTRNPLNITGDDGSVTRVSAAYLTANAFDVLRERPVVGRTFSEAESMRGGDAVVVIGDGLWRSAYGGRPNVIGETVRISGEPHTVIGVMGPGFGFPNIEEMWLPLRIEPLEGRRQDFTLTGFGRMADGTDIESAQADLELIAERLEGQYPEANEDIRSSVRRFNEWSLGDEARTFIVTMMVAATAVLLIACVNVANLLLARAASRTRDVAVRIAVGASRIHVIAQLLTEAVVLSISGAVVGLGIAYLGIRWFADSVLAADNPPFWMEFGIDPNVMIFVSLIAIGSGIIAGMLPAVQASATKVNDVLKDEARGSSSLRMSRVSRALVSAEIALSFALLVCAGLMARSILSVRNFDARIDEEALFVGNIALATDEYQEGRLRETFWDGLLDSLESEAEVSSAALISNLPGLGSPGGFFQVEGRAYTVPQDYPFARRSTVSPGFFDTTNVEPIEGRTFEDSDTRDPVPAVVVNRNFRELYFPGESPVGRRIRLGAGNESQPWRMIVGVVPDIPLGNISDSDSLSMPGIYTTYRSDQPPGGAFVVARTRADPVGLTPSVRQIIRRLDPNLTITGVNSLADALSGDIWYVGVLGTLFITFGIGGLFMAAVGLYSILAFSVRRRTGEIGIRMTLGATSGDVMRLILFEGVRQLVAGLILGLGLGILLARGIRVALFEVEPADPAMFAYVAAGLIGVGVLASYIPARRAARLNPVDAIRYD